LKFYFIRHGESEANALNLLSNYITSPYGLTDTGRGQAENAAEKIRGIAFDGFYTSPLPRAIETSEIIRTINGLPVYRIDRRLAEYGVGELEDKGDSESWARNEALWRDWFTHGQTESRVPGGESLDDIIARIREWLDAVKAEYVDPAANILAVTHGGVMNAALPFILENITGEFSHRYHIRNGSLVVAETSPDGLRCKVWNNEKIE